jgi:hypothetical protein
MHMINLHIRVPRSFCQKHGAAPCFCQKDRADPLGAHQSLCVSFLLTLESQHSSDVTNSFFNY